MHLSRNEQEANQNSHLAPGVEATAAGNRAKIKIAGVLKIKHTRLFVANNMKAFQMPFKTKNMLCVRAQFNE